MADIGDAVSEAYQAVDVTPQDHPDQAGHLNNLGLRLGDRYSKTGATADLEKAIEMARQAVNATPHDHPNRARRLNNLAGHLRSRYSRTGAITDIEEAVDIGHHAIDTTIQSNPDRAIWLNNLAVHLGYRYSRTGAISDLEEAIEKGRQAVDATPQDHPDRAGWLNNLANHLKYRYNRIGAISDLGEAIKTARQAVDATPEEQSDRVGWLSNLASHLRDRYYRTGEISDLEEAIEKGRQAVDVTPQDHPNRAGRLNNLAGHLGYRYSRTGAMNDLEEAIEKGRQAVDSTPWEHSDRARRLSSLASHLGYRYSRTGAISDLEEAIEKGRQAVDATPREHSDQVGRLNNVASYLQDRYRRIGAMSDLEEAIEKGRQAVDATPQDHPDRAGWLNNLADYLWDRYNRIGAMSDLEEAIEKGRQAVDATPQDHPDRAGCLNNLANYLRDRYHRIGAISDLGEAIKTARQAVNSTSYDHPNQAGLSNNLAQLLGDRHSRTGAMADLELSYCHFANAFAQNTASISNRIIAGKQLLSSDWALKDTSNVIKHAEIAIELLPRLAPSSLQNADKQHLLLHAAGLASNAAAIALTVQQTSVKAVTWLEAGRGILANGLQNLRTNISALRQKHPDLAAAFDNSRAILDAPIYGKSGDHNEFPSLSVETETKTRRQAHKELEKTIQEIRKQAGFNRFFLPPAEDEILASAANGPIVMINVSRHRCDALIVLPTSVQCVELSKDLYRRIQDRRKTISSPSNAMLQWLWDSIVDPILTQLGMLTSPQAKEPWPRIWWIPTGPLVGFPLHAAGYHLEDQGRTALDRVVSSYALSLRSIRSTMQSPRQRRQNIAAGSKVALIAMKATPKQSPLRFAEDETRTVQTVCESIGLASLLPDPRKRDVLAALQISSIFHFAGHGGTDISPLNSRLLLEDWEEDPLTVDSLLQTNLSSNSPFLAYLSACGTGQVRKQEMLDEGIHLAAAYQLAGFRHVIGTLWSVDDSMCVDMARLIYEFLADKEIDDKAVREGLHHASRKLRDLWVENSNVKNDGAGGIRLARDAELDNDTDREKSASWIPYVHYGA